MLMAMALGVPQISFVDVVEKEGEDYEDKERRRKDDRVTMIMRMIWRVDNGTNAC